MLDMLGLRTHPNFLGLRANDRAILGVAAEVAAFVHPRYRLSRPRLLCDPGGRGERMHIRCELVAGHRAMRSC
jgi:hypothetical protein